MAGHGRHDAKKMKINCPTSYQKVKIESKAFPKIYCFSSNYSFFLSHNSEPPYMLLSLYLLLLHLGNEEEKGISLLEVTAQFSMKKKNQSIL